LKRSRDPETIVGEHDSWRARCLNLIPSENVMSDAARSLLSCDMAHRYTLPGIEEMDGRRVENAYRGARFLDEIEACAVELACKVFRCRYACVRPISGHVSALIALASVCRRDDLIMAQDFAHGGYPGYQSDEMAGMLGLRSRPLPFDEGKWDIDYDEAVEAIVKERPRAVILGASKMLFPPEISTIRKACDEAGSALLFDASHVLGLVAGRCFGDPLGKGVDVLFGSTHKTLFGPQGGIILTDRREMMASIERSLHWKSIDNAHWNRIASLAQALLEMESFGEAYARQVVLNAKRLARALDRWGFPVQCRERDYTESHQVGLDGPEVARELHEDTFEDVAKKLEQADIIIDCVGRLGTNEVTRLGMKESEMEMIADLIARVLIEHEEVSSVREEVHAMRSKFSRPTYCFARRRAAEDQG